MSPDVPTRLIVPADNAFTLAACAEMIFTDRPFLERVEAIASRGLKVEMWDWTVKDLDALKVIQATQGTPFVCERYAFSCHKATTILSCPNGACAQ